MEKKGLLKILSMFLIVNMFATIVLVNPSLAADEVHVTNNIKWIVKPNLNYQSIRAFHDGLAKVTSLEANNKFKYGFIDKNGHEIVPLTYDAAEDFSEGLAAVHQENGNWGFVNRDGKVVIPFIFDGVESFSNDLAWVKKDGAWGFIDRNGETVLPFEYTLGPSANVKLSHLTKNLVRLVKNNNGSESLYDISKRSLLFTADRIIKLSDGLIKVQQGDKFGFINESGEIILPIIYDRVEDFHEGLAVIGKKDPQDGIMKFGYMNKSGEIVIPCIYRTAGDFSDGVAVVGIDIDRSTHKWTLRIIDKEGNDTLGRDISDYFKIGSFINGIAIVDNFIDQHHKLGLINKSGELVLPVDYDSIYDNNYYFDGKQVLFPNGTKIVVKDGKRGLLDRNGKVILEPSYAINFLTDHVLDVTKGGESRLMSADTYTPLGKMIFQETSFTPIIMSALSEGPLFSVYTMDGKRVALNEAGEQVLPVPNDKSNDFEPFYASEGVVTVRQNGKWGVVVNPLVQPDEWAKPEVEVAFSSKLVPEEMQYGYRDNITRVDFSKLVVNLLTVKTGKTLDKILADKGKTINKDAFNDTFDEKVLTAYSLGIVGGKADGVFDPNGYITRQEAAVILSRTAKVLNMNGSSTGTNFADNNDIASWAKDAVAFVSTTKDKTNQATIMGDTGDNKFSPNASYTRQQAFITINRLFNVN